MATMTTVNGGLCGADTLIVWTETTGIDMALSFQEAEGCATIWSVLSNFQYYVQVQIVEEGAYDLGSCVTLQGFC